jgi:hypothetical protein
MINEKISGYYLKNNPTDLKSKTLNLHLVSLI